MYDIFFIVYIIVFKYITIEFMLYILCLYYVLNRKELLLSAGLASGEVRRAPG